MTFTEQDKELREQVDRLIIENQSDDGSIDISDQRAMRDEILELITADRKRVALEEWDIANEAVLKNSQVISDEQEKLEALALVDTKSHNDKIGNYMDGAFGFDLAFQPFAEARRKRIAELKAQQEEK